MKARGVLAVVAVSLALGGPGAGCISPAEFVNPELVSALVGGQSVAVLPGTAPGLLVWVENRTNRQAEVVISYRDANDSVKSYTTAVSAGDKSGQMLICPVKEITLGSVSDLTQPGAHVALSENIDVSVPAAAIPYIDVEAFGVLLREGVNYDCGDSLLFVVQPSGMTRSGYETIAFFRRATTQ